MSSSGGSRGGSALTWPLALGTDESFQPTGIASNALTLHNPAAAVNGITLNGGATGVAPAIAAVGTDANVGIELDTKGTGALIINGAAGAAGQFLQSNGAGAAPTWGTAAGVSWPLTNAGDETFRPDGIANNALTLQNVAAATMGVTIIGNANANAGGTIVATGAANTRLVLASNGTSDVLIANGGGIGGSNQPALSIGGTNAQLVADASGFLILKSGGNLTIRANGVTTGIVAFSSLNGTTNGLFFQTSASGTGSQILATGGDANVDLRLAMTGTGVLDLRYATTALGGGAAPTLGTIGGSGPATAAQNSWLQLKINGTVSYLPVWR